MEMREVDMKLCRNEEILFREINALSGDLAQIAEAITRNHEERIKEVEDRRKQLEQELGAGPRPAVMMRIFDRTGLLSDLNFLRQRLDLLCSYLESPDKDQI